jgi:hypothetical protein
LRRVAQWLRGEVDGDRQAENSDAVFLVIHTNSQRCCEIGR